MWKKQRMARHSTTLSSRAFWLLAEDMGRQVRRGGGRRGGGGVQEEGIATEVGCCAGECQHGVPERQDREQG